MTGYPDAPLDARVELDLGGWTDVTQWALPDGANYATITSGESDSAQQASPASLTTTWDNPDGRFTPRNAAGPWFGLIRQNTRARVSVASPYGNVLRIDGAGSCSCPSSSALNVPADLDVRVWFDSDGWVTPGAAIPLIAKWASGTSNSWYIELIPAGSVRFWRSATGADGASADSTLPLPPGRLALRVTYAPSGAVTFYTAPGMAGPWTQLGDVVTISGGGNIFAGTAHVALPPEDGFAGSVYAAEIRGDSGLVASPDFTAQATGAASFADGQGNTWTVTGPAEITGRDYRLHGELSSVNPAVDSSKANPRVQATIAGPLRRVQQGSSPPVASPMKRAMVTRPGSLAPVAYWPCEDGAGATSLASGTGGPAMQWDKAPDLAADTSFPGSGPLPQLNGSRWTGNVPAYAGSGNIITRFFLSLGSPPASGTVTVLRMIGSGTCVIYSLRYASNGELWFTGYSVASGELFTHDIGFFSQGPYWFSLEMRPSGSSVACTVDWLQPGAGTAFTSAASGNFAGVVGKALRVDVNPFGILTDTAVGHISVQGDWETMFSLQGPLDAYAGERAGTRWLRLCGENGYPARCYGAPELSQPMGPQPSGTFWDILQEIPEADLGITYEPRDTFALGYRTAASMCNQQPAATLSYDESNLPGDLAPADDDQNLVNDWTVSLPDGTSARVVEDDPALQTSTVNAGTYQNTATANLASGDGQLLDNAGQRLAASSADESRVRQVTADFGIPSAPVADLARVRPGDLITVQAPPDLLQTGDIRQLATGTTEVLGPGRAITWDCVPASPWDVAVFDDPVTGRADTDGSVLDEAVTATATTLQVRTTGPSGIGWTEDAADFPFDVAAGGEQMTVTAIGQPASPGTYFGAYLDNTAYGSHTGWPGALASWTSITGIPLGCGRQFLGTSNFTWGGSLAVMASAGTRIILDLKPAYSPVSAADLANLETFLQAAQAAGADMKVSLWHEPYFDGLSAAQYTAMMKYYGPTVRKYFPLWHCFSGPDAVASNGYYMGPQWVDGVAVDDYSIGTDDLANAAALADPDGLPVGLWEFNCAFDLGIATSPVTGITQAQNQAYLTAVQQFFTDRLAAGKPNGDILLFSAGVNGATGTGNFLGTSLSQDGGFEGGIGNWVPHTNSTIAPSTAQAKSGTGSLAITATAAGTVSASMCAAANVTTQAVPVTSGRKVALSMWMKAGATGRLWQPGILVRDASGTLLGTAYASAVTDTTTGWTFISGVVTAPAAGYAVLDLQGTSVAAGEVHYADDPQISTLPATTDHTAPVQYPWDWRIAYLSAMQSALNATSYAQAMTVTRGGGGVAKAHSAGEDVRLWHTPRYASL